LLWLTLGVGLRGVVVTWEIQGRGPGGIPLLFVEIFLEMLISVKFLVSSIQQRVQVMTEEEYYL